MSHENAANGRRIALLFGSFRGGGVARTMLRTARGFLDRGYAVDLVVGRDRGDLKAVAPADAEIIVLKHSAKLTARAYILAADRDGFRTLAKPVLFARKPPTKLRYLPDLVSYFRRARPDAVLAATAPFNIDAVWAQRLTRRPCRVVASEHNQLDNETVGDRHWRYDIPPAVLRHVYLQADAIVAVSDGAADALAEHAGIARHRITTVYNPVVGPHLSELAAAPLDQAVVCSGRATSGPWDRHAQAAKGLWDPHPRLCSDAATAAGAASHPWRRPQGRQGVGLPQRPDPAGG